METTSISNFLNNSEAIINNIITNKEPVTITSSDGNLILTTEEEYKKLIMLAKLNDYHLINKVNHCQNYNNKVQ